MRKPLKYPEASLQDILISKTREPDLFPLRKKIMQSLSKKEAYRDMDLLVISALIDQTFKEISINISIINELIKHDLLTDKEAKAIVYRALQYKTNDLDAH